MSIPLAKPAQDRVTETARLIAAAFCTGRGVGSINPRELAKHSFDIAEALEQERSDRGFLPGP